MVAKNTKRIEEAAVNALKTALLRCQYVESYIDTNDKTPSWDGTIFVYKSTVIKKSNWMGNIPIQVKGTGTQIVSELASFSCSTVDLNNYYNDGGCIFFLISVDPENGWHKIFYASLLTYDLAKILKSAKKQASVTVKLKTFYEHDANEMMNIFMSFVLNRPKQMSVIGKDILSLEELKKNDVVVESLSFSTTGIGFNQRDFNKFLSTREVYLYAQIKGSNIDIPVGKATNLCVITTVTAKIKVDNKVFYSSYDVIYEKGEPILKLGQGIFVYFYEEKRNIKVKFNPSGTLSEYIKDEKFFIAIAENKELFINDAQLYYGETSLDYITKRKMQLKYFCDIKKMLEILGVTEELEIDEISEMDHVNLKNFVGAILYNRKIKFPQCEASLQIVAFKIANLVIQIFVYLQEDGYHVVKNFFEKCKVALFDDSDINHEHPIPASHYLMLKSDTFQHSSNIDYNQIYQDLVHTEYSPQMMNQAVLLLLEMLKGYDKQKTKDQDLLALAAKVCSWIETTGAEINKEVILVNKLQIIKRDRRFNIDELVKLASLKNADKHISIRCGAFLLLDDDKQAQSCFDKMSNSEKQAFLEYPVNVFGKLKINDN